MSRTCKKNLLFFFLIRVFTFYFLITFTFRFKPDQCAFQVSEVLQLKSGFHFVSYLLVVFFEIILDPGKGAKNAGDLFDAGVYEAAEKQLRDVAVIGFGQVIVIGAGIDNQDFHLEFFDDIDQEGEGVLKIARHEPVVIGPAAVQGRRLVVPQFY